MTTTVTCYVFQNVRRCSDGGSVGDGSTGYSTMATREREGCGARVWMTRHLLLLRVGEKPKGLVDWSVGRVRYKTDYNVH
jgi:hypothetical protein